MQFTFDPRYNVAYIRFREEQGTEVETVCVSEELNVDVAPDGSVYGIELLNANEQLGTAMEALLRVRNEATGEEAEMRLPIGA